MEVLVQIDAYDPVAAAAVTLYAASRDSDQMCHLNGQTWFPVIARLPVLRYDLFDGSFGRRIDAPSSGIQLGTEPWPNFARYAFADARVRLWTGNVGDAWGSWTLRFDGRCTAQPRIVDGLAELYFAVDDRWLDTPLLSTYAGTGGAEGATAQKGVAKPLALGAPRFVSGVLIDQTNNVVQLSSAGLIEDVEVAFEGLSRFSASVGDYASYAALVAATIPAGRWATAKAVGMVRHGAPLAGKPAYHVKGDKAGPDAWARKPGQLIRRIALLSGGSGKISDASLNALDVARPWNVSLYVDQQTTARELIQRIAASVNAVAGVSWLGQLFVVPIGIGTPSATLAADGSALPPIGTPQQIDVAAPWWRLAQQSETTWAVHGLGDVQFTATLTDRGTYSGATTYREGDIVYQPTDGRTYLYTATTPTAGNAPPNVTYWALYQAGDPGIAGNANRVRFSQFEGGTVGWALNWNPNGISSGALSIGTSSGISFVRLDGTATAASQRYALGIPAAYRFAVTPGERLSVQLKLKASGAVGSTGAFIVFVDAAGAAVGSTITIGTATGVTPYSGAEWFDARTFADVPAGAVAAYIEIHNISSGAGAMQAYLAQPMVTQAGADQVVHPSFSPGPNAADGATVGADWETNVSNIPYAQVLNNDDSVALGFNPTFSEWSGTYPDGWSSWSTGGTISQETSIVRVGKFAPRFAMVGTDRGLQRLQSWATAPMPAGTFISGSIDAYLVARTSGKPGILVDLFTEATLTSYRRTTVEVPETATGLWQRIPWTARVNAGEKIYGIRIYIMGSFTGLPSGSFTGTVVFDNLRFAFFDNSVDNNALPFNQNLLPNSEQTSAVTWSAVAYNPNGATFANSGVPRLASATWTEADYALASGTTKNVYVDQTNRATGTADGSGDNAVAGDIGLQDGNGSYAWIPVEAGQDYIYSCYIANHRCAASIAIIWANAAGTTISNSFSGQFGPTNANANSLALYQRASVRGTAPAGAVKARVIVRKFNTVSGQTQSYLWWAAPQLERVPSGVSAPSPYVPGPPCTVTQLGYSGDLNATNGAPTGTSVGGTAAATVAAGANAANNGVNSDGTIKTDRVNTPAIQANAVTSQAYASTAGSVSSSPGSAAAIQSVTATIGSGLVQIAVSFNYSVTSGGSGAAAAGVTLRRNGTVIANLGNVGGTTGIGDMRSFNWIDLPGAGSHTYDIYVTGSGSPSSSISYTNRLLALTEAKR